MDLAEQDDLHFDVPVRTLRLLCVQVFLT